ncbi:MAG: VRR-NUC domain-containing protein [Staphylococcus equorum]|nr:VRR-NUC domain-containing protein [Staphylococcus equorum]
MEKSEKRIQDLILLGISKRGHKVYRTNAGKVKDARSGAWIQMLPKGFPDVAGWRKDDGKFFAIEIKNAKGKLRKEQKQFAKFASTQPIIYGVARSKEDAIHIIENGLNGYGV